jgi:hypothetical protein
MSSAPLKISRRETTPQHIEALTAQGVALPLAALYAARHANRFRSLRVGKSACAQSNERHRSSGRPFIKSN